MTKYIGAFLSLVIANFLFGWFNEQDWSFAVQVSYHHLTALLVFAYWSWRYRGRAPTKDYGNE